MMSRVRTYQQKSGLPECVLVAVVALQQLMTVGLRVLLLCTGAMRCCMAPGTRVLLSHPPCRLRLSSDRINTPLLT